MRAAKVYSRITNTMDRLQEFLKTFSLDTIFSNFDNEQLNKVIVGQNFQQFDK